MNATLKHTVVALALAALAACAQRLPPPAFSGRLHPPLPLSRSSALPSPQASVAPPFNTAALPPGIERPKQVACALQSQDLDRDRLFPLAFEPGRPPYAVAAGAVTAEALVPVGDAGQGVWVEVQQESAVLDGRITAAGLPVHPSRAGIVAGTILLQPSSRMLLQRAVQGSMTVVLAPDPKVRLVRAAEVTLPCADLVLKPTAFEAREAVLAKGAPTPSYVEIKRKKGWLQLHASPSGPAVASLDVTTEQDDTRVAELLEVRQGWARVILASNTNLLVGWVPTRVLDLQVGLLGLLGTGTDSSAPTSPWGEIEESPQGGRARTCAWNSPLIAEQEGKARTVGRLLPAHPLEVGERSGPLQAVGGLAQIQPDKGVQLRTIAAALYPCRARTSAACPKFVPIETRAALGAAADAAAGVGGRSPHNKRLVSRVLGEAQRSKVPTGLWTRDTRVSGP